jgi:hypothetical protein
MRAVVILAIAFGILWAVDAHEYDGRYSHDLWQRAAADGPGPALDQWDSVRLLN